MEFKGMIQVGNNNVSGTNILNTVLYFLLGNSPTSELYMPTFRNTLFYLHTQVGMKFEIKIVEYVPYFEWNFHANGCNMKNRKILWAVEILNILMESNLFERHYV